MSDLLDHYVTVCDDTFKALGVEFTAEELAGLRKVLSSQVAEAFKASPRSEVQIEYEAPYGLDRAVLRQGAVVQRRGRLRELGRHP